MGSWKPRQCNIAGVGNLYYLASVAHDYRQLKRMMFFNSKGNTFYKTSNVYIEYVFVDILTSK